MEESRTGVLYLIGAILDTASAGSVPRIARNSRPEIELTLMDMDKDATPPERPERKPPSLEFFTILFAIAFFLLLLLLGMSMVHHRFFQGEREHRNGSVGQ
jgi:hypothetical protein